MIRPFFRVRTRLHVRQQMLAQGYSRSVINSAVDAIDEEIIEVAATEAKAMAEIDAIGDGRFLQRVIDFFKSPAGQLFLSILLKLLLGVLLGTENGRSTEASGEQSDGSSSVQQSERQRE